MNMGMYKKVINGIVQKKNLSEIVLHIEGKQVINPTKEMVIADGWVLCENVPPTEEELVEQVKQWKIKRLYEYDESKKVNDCIIVYQGQELHYWADKTERDALKGALRDCISMGRDTYRLDLRDKGVSISLPCEVLLQMLAALEVYAIDCYNKTTDHEFAIKALTTKEEVEAYDFKVGYPEKLRFEV